MRSQKSIQTRFRTIDGVSIRFASVNATDLHRGLPNSRLDLVDAAHFVWEDAADAYADLVTNWWNGGYSAPR